MFDRLRHWLQPAEAAGSVATAEPSPSAAQATAGAQSPQGGAVADAPMVLVDVRSPAEFAGGALQGAHNLPLSDLAGRIGDVAPDLYAPVVLYCASGGRSGVGCQVLRQLGYANVHNAGGVYAAAAQLGRGIA